ncbi:hypothetical protein FB567DRAFT_571729 [Paraphoma chrysanthemicola]|uniref:Small nuclear ribonucleoprotein Prp3 C-terminal domain-containing protein n=1 Tax=Paraphoma chrysanthemicola TaxID=798071 RepID=A0A8K0QZK7_9PLEO|nr:hypothetical protein FB567DRAFT_571729 [Paraphoma chrysanthemicola]
MASSVSWQLLPPDLIELQLGQIDLLLAMYPDDTVLGDSASKSMEVLRNLSNGAISEANFADAPSVPLSLQVSILAEDKNLLLDIIFPFTHDGSKDLEDAPRPKVRIVQPSWLSKAATNQLMTDIPPDEDLLGVIEHIKDAAAKQLETSNQHSTSTPDTPSGPLVRVWFYFPSISTRSKRDDFITHAPSYSLTGFLYAGKPGLLCVEGTSQNIDEYMRFIKTESWGDIPAHHKKVSERYRESDVQRVWAAMEEITDSVGERRGQRVNRGDMRAVEEWLGERGLGGVLERVLM